MPVTVFDIEALGELTAPLPALTAGPAERAGFWAAWERASADKEDIYLDGDRGRHRRAWEDGE